MKHIIPILIIVSVAVGMTACKKEDPDKTVKLYSMVGNVKVVISKKEKGAAVGDVLLAGDSIRTGADSIADILFGTAGIIRVQPDSNIDIATLMDPISGDSQLNMAAGKINVTLAKLKKGDFRVQTPTAVASVRGTTFRITADEKAMRLDVVTGAVKVNPIHNNTVVSEVETMVETNQTVNLDEKAVKQAIEEKKEIKVTELKAEDVEKIKDEVRDIKPGILEKLNKDAQKEIREKVLAPDDSAAREKREKEEKEKKEKEKKERAMKLLREQKLREQMNREKDKLKQQDTGKKQKDGSGSDSKSAPPSLQTL
jgi:hypothetical protein